MEDEVLRDSKKFLSLCEAFDINAGNMEENMQNEKKKIIDSLTTSDLQNVDVENVNTSIIETEDLMKDFSFIRKNLRANIDSTSILLEKFGNDLSASHAEDVSGQMLLGYSELIKSSNTSMKLLIESYSSVSKTQNEIKKLIQENKTIESEQSQIDNSVTNVVNFVGTPYEMLESLKKG